MSDYSSTFKTKTYLEIKDDFQKLFGENCSVISVTISELFDNEILHQVTTIYKNKMFQNLISEIENNYTVLSINTTRKFQTQYSPKADNIKFPISTLEHDVSIKLETIHNFPFDKNKVIKIYDKMIESKISFDEII